MTEAEWESCTDPDAMMSILRSDWKTLADLLRGTPYDRKLQLFAVACCRRISHLFLDDRARRAVEIAERNADGLASREELSLARDTIRSTTANISAYYAVDYLTWFSSANPRSDIASYVMHKTSNAVGDAKQHECVAQCQLLRCIVGFLPFRAATIDQTWRSPKVLALAQSIYDDRGFERLPFLADVLVDAGCDNEDILAHCRNEGPHVRGCWVVDLILGKE